VKAYNNKGIILKGMRKYEEAIVQYNKAILVDPSYEKAYFNIGLVFQTLGNLKEAIVHYDKAIELSNPKNSLYYCSRGTAYTELGQTVKALQDFKTADSLVQQDIWGKDVTDANKNCIKRALSAICKLQRVVEETQKRLEKLDQEDLSVQSAAARFKMILKEDFRFISQQIARFDTQKPLSQEEINKGAQKMRELETTVKKLCEEMSMLKEKVTIIEKTVQELRNNIEQIRQDLKASGVLDKVKIQEGFRDLENNAPELYAYAKAFYWTLLNYLMAYRNPNTRVWTGVAGNEEYQSSTKAYLVQFGMNVTESIPVVGGVVRLLNDALSIVNEAQAKIQFENQANTVNKIVMEHHGEDELNRTVAFTALAVAFKLKTANSFNFDQTNSTSIWKQIDNKVTEPIEKIKSLFLQETIDLYDGPAAAAALRDVMLLLAYLQERYEFVIRQKRDQNKPFHEQFVSIIVLKKYTDVLEPMPVALENSDKGNNGNCGSHCSIF